MRAPRVVFSFCFLLGCSGSDGAAGANGTSYLTNVSAEAAGANCAQGGARIEVGPDRDGNGALDASEVTKTQYICNGSNGSSGTDGVNGRDGANGTDGKDGTSTLTTVATEASGANCAAGGVRIDSGADANANGTLESSEVTSTKYVCNGASGEDAPAPRALATNEPAGANCAFGGTRLQLGSDANKNGALDSSEVTTTQYICSSDPAAGSGATPAVSGQADGDLVLSSSSGLSTLHSLSITVPRKGSIVAIATVDAFCSTSGAPACNSGGTTSAVMSVTSNPSGAADTGSWSYFWLTPNGTENISRTGVFPVTAAGTYTYYVRTYVQAGAIGFYRRGLTLVFVPSA